MKQKIVLYLANHKNPTGDNTEEHISDAILKLGYKLIRIHENDRDFFALGGLEGINPDILLFHKGGPHIVEILKRVKYKKVCYYFDKVWHGREDWMKNILPLVDHVFLSDETWAKANPNPKLHILHQGIGTANGIQLGIKSPMPQKIAFTGTIYEGREDFVQQLKKKYGADFGVFSFFWNRDLFNLCASVPIFIAPPFPSDDYYWSSRIYITIGSGGFVLHPRCKGLDKEYKDGIHYVSYDSMADLIQKVDYYLAHSAEADKIRLAGYQHTTRYLTYKNRMEELFKNV